MLKWFWRNIFIDRVSRSLFARHADKISLRDNRILELETNINELKSKLGRFDTILENLPKSKMENLEITENLFGRVWDHSIYNPDLRLLNFIDKPFMPYSTVSALDFFNKKYIDYCDTLGIGVEFHRKNWEWVYIYQHALRLGVVGPDKKILGFAVGTEPLPSAFAALGANVVATDAPFEIGQANGWVKTDQYGMGLKETHKANLISWEDYNSRAKYNTCDMNNIPTNLNGFDFCWSSCSLEHLGSLEAGMTFVENTIEHVLKPGGVAIHTTEFNLSSNSDTVNNGETVLYRRKDIELLVSRLREKGHTVDEITIAPDAHIYDYVVDTPPYNTLPHLKLKLYGYVATSIGLIIKKAS